MSRNIEVDILKLKFEIDSVKERVRDVEWRMENGKDIENDARQKALDKLRHLQKELVDLEVKRLCQKLSVSQDT